MMINCKRLITVTPARLGDTLFCTPAFRFIKQQLPHVSLDVIALTPLAATVLQHNPYINQVYLAPPLSQIAKLANYYDLALNIHHSPKATQYLQLLATNTATRPTMTTQKHISQQIVDFVANVLECNSNSASCDYDLFPQTSDVNKITHQLIKHGVNIQKHLLIGMHVGCHSLAKKPKRFWQSYHHQRVWPIKQLIGLIQQLSAYNSCIRCVITGSKGEQFIGSKIVKQCPNVINLINHTSTLELGALMSLLSLYISGDTGPLHVACASDVDVIALLNQNMPIQNEPIAKHNRVIVRANHLSQLSTTAVFNQVLQCLKQ